MRQKTIRQKVQILVTSGKKSNKKKAQNATNILINKKLLKEM